MQTFVRLLCPAKREKRAKRAKRGEKKQTERKEGRQLGAAHYLGMIRLGKM